MLESSSITSLQAPSAVSVSSRTSSWLSTLQYASSRNRERTHGVSWIAVTFHEAESITRAYAVAKEANEPKPLKKDSGNQSKYCDFHRSVGHSTENYKTLQRKIEDLIRRGHLTKFVRGPGQNSGAADEEGQEQTPPQNMIAGGVVNMVTIRPAKNPADSKEQQAGRKKQRIVDNIISFSDSDSNHVMSPHVDSLIISALVLDDTSDYQLK
ncbi:hypothetical protein Nepgr_016921 [Nepenthes gracilis]|uniref:Uncharacterized protein n=1 Tax=Nepenthes gracilis TaxID=150966 RepID=A0AAD3SNH3_NEPGR|nr:hypothetical protein Nepgr_016921 [Nepenthes gracilis]